MTKLKLQGYSHRLTQVEDAKLFMHYLLLGLSSNTALTDLTLDVPHQCWDKPQGELSDIQQYVNCKHICTLQCLVSVTVIHLCHLCILPV